MGSICGGYFLSALILFVPGFLFVKSFRLSKAESLCMAPFASSLMVVLLCYIYSKIGISASFVFLFLPIAFFYVRVLLSIRLLEAHRAYCGNRRAIV